MLNLQQAKLHAYEECWKLSCYSTLYGFPDGFFTLKLRGILVFSEASEDVVTFDFDLRADRLPK